MEENGQAAGRISFDKTRPGKTLSHEDAQALLCLMYERHRGTFGALLAEVITGERYTVKRSS